MLSIHNHSYYSLMQGTIPLESLLSFAKENQSSYCALTDNNGMYGLIQFAKKAAETGIKPILGSYIDDPNDSELNAVFIAKNNSGYSQLCKIITSRKLKDDFSLIELLKQDLTELFVVSSSLKLLEKIKYCKNWNENFFAELISTKQQKPNTRKLYNFAKETNLKYIASHPAYFYKPEDFLLQKVVTAIRLNTSLENLNKSDLVDEEYYLKSADAIQKKWKAFPEAIGNIKYIVDNCNVHLKFGEYKFPVYSVPSGESSHSYLWGVCLNNLSQKYHPVTEAVTERLQKEMAVIEEMGFSDYFLIVWDIVKEAHRRGMMTIGRGSAANSIVSYLLDFTQVDPIKHNLYFERFMNRGRTSPPDVDLDFSWKERDEIVKYVFEKYGYSKVAMISTTVTFKARSAFRETAKVFGIPDSEISKFSKFIPWTRAQNLIDIAQKFPEARSLKFDTEPWISIIKIASQLADFPRHLSIHPGGIVITPEPITNYVALEYAKNKGLGLIITQPDMYPIEDAGLIKIDLLSQRSLGVLRDTLSLISSNNDQSNEDSIEIYDIKKHKKDS